MVHDPATSDLTEEFAQTYFELRQHKGVDPTKARAAVETPPVYAAMLVRSGRATGTVGGAVHTTGNIVRAAIQVIGMAPDAGMVSSFFLMYPPGKRTARSAGNALFGLRSGHRSQRRRVEQNCRRLGQVGAGTAEG